MLLNGVHGLTGGIACGKSTVARFLIELGGHVVDADEVSRAVVAPGTRGHQAVVEHFGVEILTPAGTIDRGHLGRQIFGNPIERKALETILHPRIAEESMRRITKIRNHSAAPIFYEAALLIETGRAQEFRPLVVVWSDRERQLARLKVRDGLGLDEAQQRLSSQMPMCEKIKHADHVVENNGDLEALKRMTQRLWEALVK